MNMTKRLTLGVAIGAALISLNSVAMIEENESDVVKVSYSSQELSNTEGRKALYQRLDKAARQACGSMQVSNAGSLHQAGKNQRCYKKAIERAVADIGDGALAELHSS
jgi:UrcA family protein